MITINRLLSSNSRAVANCMTDRTTALSQISWSALTPVPGRTGLMRSLLAVAAMMAGLLCSSKMYAQTTPTPQPVILADFNHDGLPDALVTSSTTPTATIAFGAVPYGTFSTGAKAVAFPAACTMFPQGSLLVGDFNGDGFPDLAFFCGNTQGVILGNGDGTFGAVKPLVDNYSQLAVAGDFNNDGKLDLAIIGITGDSIQTQTIQFLAGNGDGTFAAGVVSTLDRLTYSAPTVADLNGDGYADVVVLDVSPNSPPAFLVFGNNKDGTFGVVSQGVSAANAQATVGTGAFSILPGPFFGLAEVDLVVPGAGVNGGLSAFKNTSTATTYSFNDPVTISYANLTGAQAGSFTGSGFADVAVSNGTSIAVLVNDGAANFSASYLTLTVASTSSLFAVADANLDGYADIYTATSTAGALQLAVNVTSGSATASSQPFSLSIGTKAVSAAWNGNVNLLGTTANGQQVVTGAIAATTVASSKNPSTVGDIITFSASVVPAIAGRTPTGNVVFTDGTTPLATVLLDDTGNASCQTATLTQGTHLIRVAYAGDSYYAASTSAVLSQVVNHAPAVASNLSWATPAAIVYGTALSGTQLNATAVDATGIAIPGTFAYTPAAGTVLDAGAKTLSVTFTPTDLLSFLPASTTVPLSVARATPLVTWATPANIAYGIPLSTTQLNATVAGVTNSALPGTYTYSPAAGAILNPGTQTLSLTFVPTNAVDYTNATGSVKLTVTGLTQASFTPTSASLGAGATTITVTGSGFVTTSVVQINGMAIPTTLVNPTTLTAVIPASDLLTVGTLQISVSDPTVSLTTLGAPFTIVAPPPAASLSAPPTVDPGTQPTITFAVTKTYPVDLTVTLDLSFASSTTPQITNNQQLQLACQNAASNCVLNASNTTLTFVVPANTTTVPVILLQAGTIAGTITVPIMLNAGGANVTPSTLAPAVIVVPPAVPTVSGISLTRSGNQLTVVMHGFSNTREVVNAKFHFTAAPGASLATTDLTLPADTIFNTDYYQMAVSEPYGSTFTYTQIFNTNDGAAKIGTVDATLTNSIGASISATAK